VFGTVILKKIDKLRFKKEIEFMKTAKIYFATILSLMFCSELVSQSAADSIYYAKAKEEGRVLLYTSLATDDNNAFRSAFERANPGVKLDIYRASGTTILQKVLTENRAGANPVNAIVSRT
jgi:ABC-type glycerol-3-phosphate transport system substrate-binding protein